MGTYLTAQWLSLSLPMHGVQVQSLVRAHMPQGPKTKTRNRSNIVPYSIKTLKIVHIKKKKKQNKANILWKEGRLQDS